MTSSPRGARPATGTPASSAATGGPPDITPYDSDLLARARAYGAVPVSGVLWSLRHAVHAWTEAATMALDADVVLVHQTRGRQRACDVACTNAHDAHHHASDIRRILSQPG
jgi:hypothetical protein